ncbi:MAG: 16S rRNA (cytosine(1402)-N(4))-methyltransferase RsmH [Syntrophaceticus sp.]|jgi:16S rRNA (cytosine1402-N4)-methyltransferase|nr:16S rRNA (cytosine(1402)-N(4))-methyltransferase RsmH [Syntrophaceticus sp.]MDD3314197.1 16S rRNA (cytosine(1402)-N(4))-methyltransferase RsmH [Syntrophaceticus sp.]MDD4359359.1 16S rRNA (cytosine(1402)-N(4))-methyltransferase RsmH [Syntrophaceticus sp.]MDD4782447.1 16S rRNA (cytosine(1402)-N(4))-methyltransferase RsmH [Syntrophaceticus sp.]
MKAVHLVAEEVKHAPVMLKEAIEFLDPQEGGIYVDCTLGSGGHAKEMLRLIGPTGRLIGFDKDEFALKRSKEVLAPYLEQVIFIYSDFRQMVEILHDLQIDKVDGIIFDLGVSSNQVLEPERGFSYNYDAFLDMRMDQSSATTAADLVNTLPEKELADIIFRYGEERWARRIASFIVDWRKKSSVTTTGQLVEIIKAAIPARARRTGPHPARRTFMALRIAVNDELTGAEAGLRAGISLLKQGGRIVAISFHSLEDRIVKNVFREYGHHSRNEIRILTKKPIIPDDAEVKANSRSRSAKLRAAEKLLPDKE